MAYSKTNWVNDTTPINADHLNNIENGIETLDNEIGVLNDLETQNTNTIVNALNGLATGEIVESNLSASAGYIKYSNGFMIEWTSKSATLGGTQWDSVYYSDVNMNNWLKPFVLIFGTALSCTSALYNLAGDGASTTNAGLVRATRPNSGTSTATVRVIGFGTWK